MNAGKKKYTRKYLKAFCEEIGSKCWWFTSFIFLVTFIIDFVVCVVHYKLVCCNHHKTFIDTNLMFLTKFYKISCSRRRVAAIIRCLEKME